MRENQPWDSTGDKSGRRIVWRYAVAALTFVGSLLARFALSSVLGSTVPYITFFPCIVVSAWYGGLGPGLAATALSAIAATYLVLVPNGITSGELVSLGLFVAIGALISWLNHALRRSEERTQKELTARRQSEVLVTRNERRFRALIENSSDAIAIIDHEMKILYASASTRRVLGYLPEDFTGGRAFELLHPDDQERVPSLCASLLEGIGYEVRTEVRVRHNDGSWRWIDCHAVNALQERHIEGIVVNYRDVTGPRLLQEQFLQSQKMEAVGSLAGGVAHDFNNLLTVINGYSSLVLETLEPSSEPYREIEEIHKAGTRAASLTRQLLAFSRQALLEPKVINLNLIVHDIDRMLRRLIGEDVDLATVLDSALGLVRVDPGQVEQMILNLAINARHAMPRGGHLTIETSNADLDEAYAEAHRGTAPGAYVMLAVSDTGVGMTEEIRARIFEPFFTTKPKGEGTGLGLSMVYGFVKQSGGNIWVYTEPGRGTTFKIYLPRLQAPEAGPVSEQRLPAKVTGGSETILVVEDEEAVRHLVRITLQKTGYTIFEARDGRDAVSFCESYTGPIHLVISDVVMPQLGGQELAQYLMRARPESKTLFISGYTDNAVVRHGVLSANTAFLQKPFTPATLTKKVREVLESAENCREQLD